MPGTAWPASCASVWPPRLEPPVPSRTMSLAPARSRSAAARIGARSSCAAGSRKSGSPPSAWRARSQSSASALRVRASSSAAAATPSLPMRSARAVAIDWLTGIESRPVHLPGDGRPAGLGVVGGCALDPVVGRGDAVRAADHGGEQAAVEQALGHALGIGERHRVDQAGAALDIVDAELVELDLHQLAGDPVRGVQAERVGALEIGLGLVELLLGRAFLGEAPDLVLDDLDGLPGGVGAGGGAADQERGVIEPDQAVVDAVGKAA